MGGTKSRPLSVSGTIDCPEVSPAMLMEVMCDVQGGPAIMPDFIRFQWVRGGEEGKGGRRVATPGAVWLEDWKYGKHSITARVALIECEKGPKVYRWSATSQLEDKPCTIPNVINTFSWEAAPMSPAEEEDTKTSPSSTPGCRLQFSNAFVPVGWYARIVAGVFFRKFLVDDFDTHSRESFQYVYQEALRRTVQQLRHDLEECHTDKTTSTTSSITVRTSTAETQESANPRLRRD